MAENLLSPLSFTPSNKYCAVTLITSDEKRYKAVKSLLAIRIPYFDKLFYSSFSEAKSTETHISLTAQVLEHILEFAYTGMSKYMRSAHETVLAFADTDSDVNTNTIMDHVEELLSISGAADYCHLSDLQTYCAKILQVI